MSSSTNCCPLTCILVSVFLHLGMGALSPRLFLTADVFCPLFLGVGMKIKASNVANNELSRALRLAVPQGPSMTALASKR